jgi:hypothetical protein
MLGFGICTAPGIYHNRMLQIVGDLYLNGCLVYIDDIIVYGRTIDEFLQRLDILLTRLADSNVRLKPKKDFFGYRQINFLGHVFDEDGYQLSQERRDGILNISIPSTVKQLKSFLGSVNYFRAFVPNLSTLLAPLTDLTKGIKKGPISWTSEAQRAFDDIKMAVLNAYTLSWPNETDPYILYTDASDVGVGAMLVQLQQSGEVPIGFFSKKFTEVAQRWSTIEKECFALFAAVIFSSRCSLAAHFSFVRIIKIWYICIVQSFQRLLDGDYVSWNLILLFYT